MADVWPWNAHQSGKQTNKQNPNNEKEKKKERKRGRVLFRVNRMKQVHGQMNLREGWFYKRGIGKYTPFLGTAPRTSFCSSSRSVFAAKASAWFGILLCVHTSAADVTFESHHTCPAGHRHAWKTSEHFKHFIPAEILRRAHSKSKFIINRFTQWEWV